MEFRLLNNLLETDEDHYGIFKMQGCSDRFAYLPERTEQGSQQLNALSLIASVACQQVGRSNENDSEDNCFEMTSIQQQQDKNATASQEDGCQAKTSRSHVPCKRQTFNGSEFCKLHYQQYAKKSNCAQDKRYTGLDDEVRCVAVTTRGRACGYVAVNSSRYCYLHADYETNPPPRRSKEVVAAEVQSSDESSTIAAELDSDSKKPGKRRTTAKLKQMHAESPFPLLSMISTDQWFGRTVKCAVGPLMGRLGIVEKWGNGWVSVNIKGHGYHNRRSFELYIEDADVQELQHATDNHLTVFRTVSRDVVSPSPSTDLSRRTPSSLKSSSSEFLETPRPEFRNETSLHIQSPVPMKPNGPPEVTPFPSERPVALPGDLNGLELPTSPRPTNFTSSMGERTRSRSESLQQKHGHAFHGIE